MFFLFRNFDVRRGFALTKITLYKDNPNVFLRMPIKSSKHVLLITRVGGILIIAIDIVFTTLILKPKLISVKK